MTGSSQFVVDFVRIPSKRAFAEDADKEDVVENERVVEIKSGYTHKMSKFISERDWDKKTQNRTDFSSLLGA